MCLVCSRGWVAPIIRGGGLTQVVDKIKVHGYGGGLVQVVIVNLL
jgi:hypothetical protein